MVVESLIYVKIFGGAIQTLKCCTIFCPGLNESSTKLSQSARYQTPAARNPLHPLHANVGFSAAFSVASKVEVAMPHSFPTKTQPLDPQNPMKQMKVLNPSKIWATTYNL